MTVYKPKKVHFLDPTEIEAAIREVEHLARAKGVYIALLGGAAMQLYGSDRLTKDVDFAADELLPLRNPTPLSFGGIQGFTPGTSKPVPVDLIVRNDDYAPLYKGAIATAQEVEGVPMLVVIPEYLAVIKLAAGRRKDEEDLAFLIGSGELNLETTRAIVKKYLGHYALEEFDSLVDRVEWEARKK